MLCWGNSGLGAPSSKSSVLTLNKNKPRTVRLANVALHSASSNVQLASDFANLINAETSVKINDPSFGLRLTEPNTQLTTSRSYNRKMSDKTSTTSSNAIDVILTALYEPVSNIVLVYSSKPKLIPQTPNEMYKLTLHPCCQPIRDSLPLNQTKKIKLTRLPQTETPFATLTYSLDSKMCAAFKWTTPCKLGPMPGPTKTITTNPLFFWCSPAP